MQATRNPVTMPRLLDGEGNVWRALDTCGNVTRPEDEVTYVRTDTEDRPLVRTATKAMIARICKGVTEVEA